MKLDSIKGKKTKLEIYIIIKLFSAKVFYFNWLVMFYLQNWRIQVGNKYVYIISFIASFSTDVRYSRPCILAFFSVKKLPPTLHNVISTKSNTGLINGKSTLNQNYTYIRMILLQVGRITLF